MGGSRESMRQLTVPQVLVNGTMAVGKMLWQAPRRAGSWWNGEWAVTWTWQVDGGTNGVDVGHTRDGDMGCVGRGSLTTIVTMGCIMKIRTYMSKFSSHSTSWESTKFFESFTSCGHNYQHVTVSRVRATTILPIMLMRILRC